MTEPDETRARRARAEARGAAMVIRKGRLGDEIDLTPVRGSEAVALAARLSAAAWSVSGRALPGPWPRPVVVEFRRRSA